MKWKWVLRIASAAIVSLIVAAYVILSSYSYNGLKPEITSAVKDDTGRELTLGGDISLKIGFTPALVVKDVSLQNASWGSQPELAKIKRFEISLDELTRPFKLGGTLAHPSLAVDSTQTAIIFGKAIGGVMLFGPVGIAAVLVGSSSGDENSCMAAIEAAKKGVRAKKGLVGKVTEGAGKEFNKLFGK